VNRIKLFNNWTCFFLKLFSSTYWYFQQWWQFYCVPLSPTLKLTHLMIDWFRFLSSIMHYILHAWQAFVELLFLLLHLLLVRFLILIFVIIILMKFQRDVWHYIQSLYYGRNVIYSIIYSFIEYKIRLFSFAQQEAERIQLSKRK